MRFITLPTVARLKFSSSMTSHCSVSRVTVQRACPSGGVVHAPAMIFASTSPVAFSLAVSEFGFRAGWTAAASPSWQYFFNVSMTVGMEAPDAEAISLFVGICFCLFSSAARRIAYRVLALDEAAFFRRYRIIFLSL